jgi:hypothetical protein
MKMIVKRNALSAAVLGGALLMAGLLATNTAKAQDAAKGGKTATLTGVVSDAMCGSDHHGKDAAKCTNACASKGKYALVIGDRVVTLDEAPTADMQKLAGQKATVTGTMTGKDSMKATKVEAAKS